MRARLVMSWVAVVVALVALSACSSGGDDDASTPTSSSSTSSSSSSSPSSSSSVAVATTTSASSTSLTSTTAPPTAAITLAPDGFTIGTKRYTYAGGASPSAIKDAFRTQLGSPVKEADFNCDAGKLHSVRWKAIDVYFADNRLAGWGLTPPRATPPLVTAAGIGLGSTRPEIERAYPTVQVDETSLGTEWFVAGPSPDTGLSGIFSSSEPDAVNEALWSARTCVAR